MKHYTVLMSIVDFVPVILFAVAAIILQCELYRQMSKGTFALFSVGTLDIICAGGAKALYKLLYAAGICDFKPLSDMFPLMQRCFKSWREQKSGIMMTMFCHCFRQ